MNKTNLLATLALASFTYTNTVRLTNWLPTGDSEFKNRTNYVYKWMTDITTTVTRETVTPTIVWVTNNQTIVHQDHEPFSLTNTIIIKEPHPLPPLPGTPGRL
jgi:hypothetical protein